MTTEINSDDQKLIDTITEHLETFKSQMRMEVLKMVANMPASVTKPDETPKVTPDKDGAVKLLQAELKKLTEQLYEEKLEKSVGKLAAKYKMHPDLLSMVVKHSGVSEINGQLVVGRDEPETLESFVGKYSTTSEGSRIKTQKDSGTTLKEESSASAVTDIGDALMSFI